MSELPKKLDKEIRLEARNRCGYCLGEQRYILAWLEIEHLYPRAKGGKTEKENLLAGVFFLQHLQKAHKLTALTR